MTKRIETEIKTHPAVKIYLGLAFGVVAAFLVGLAALFAGR